MDNSLISTIIQVTPATPTATQAKGTEAAKGEDVKVGGKSESKPGEEVPKKPSSTSKGSSIKNKIAAKNAIKPNESEAPKSTAKGAEIAASRVGPGSKGASAKLTGKTSTSTVTRPPAGRVGGSKSAGTGKLASVPKAPAVGSVRSKARRTSASEERGEDEKSTTGRKPAATSRQPAPKSSTGAQKSTALGNGKSLSRNGSAMLSKNSLSKMDVEQVGS